MTSSIPKPYLVFLGDITSTAFAKTAFGIRDWLPDETVGQWRLPGCGIDLGVTELTPAQAYRSGARSLLIGIASAGGQIPSHWEPALLEALESGLDIVSGLHSLLADIPAVRATAERLGRTLHDVRHAKRVFAVGSGKKRTGKRVLTVGTDCALGKKYTALAVARALKAVGLAADFRATGQTGIMIAGDGVAIDAVVADFIAGAAEALSPDAEAEHWDVIEGQGSLFHPAYAGVTLGLIHGSQPDAMILCHDPSRSHVNMYPDFPLPSLPDAVAANEAAARLTNPKASVVAISLNTASMDESEARAVADAMAALTGLPCFDPMRFGMDLVVERLRSL